MDRLRSLLHHCTKIITCKFIAGRIYSCVLINAQQVEDAASKVQAAGKGGSTTEDDELSDDDDELSSLVRTSLEMEYVTAIDSVDTSVDEFCTFRTTLESE